MSVSITDRRKSKFLANLDDNELKCIKVEITWGNVTNPNRNGPLERAIEDPRKLNINIHYRPDEGLHPIFARDDIFVNLEETVKAREPEVEKSCTCFSRNRSPQPHSSRSYPECDSCRSSVSKKIVFRRSQESSHDRELLLKRSQERSQQNQERIRERSPGKKERSRERSPKENFERNRERSSRQNRERSREPSIKYHRSDSATESRRSRTPSVRNRERSPSRSRDRSVSNSRVLLSKRRSREKSPNYHRFYSPRGSRRSRTPARRRSRSYSPHRRSRYSRSPDYRHYERSHSPRRYWYTPERERYSRTSSPDERAFPLPRIPNPFNEGPEFWMPDPASQVRFIPPPPLPAPFPCGPFRPPMMPQRPTFWPRIIFDRPPRLTFDQELENFSESFENNQ